MWSEDELLRPHMRYEPHASAISMSIRDRQYFSKSKSSSLASLEASRSNLVPGGNCSPVKLTAMVATSAMEMNPRIIQHV
jgi:hypothetical protein